ncbi:hypothetical protein GHT07_05770 [Caenimonas koreensis DSM 17982]|uniref:Uncharacterized protein n=1 Tax=Caenimonas koreensis DSM 17982 TaxID=1121255 RepID=A0A844B0X1_9BURK|nr:hypothetical protein [Caenimonas koreensis]MRD46773.1 hypothetical protein [Caenimonas koreensis DSM 17982]
MDELAITAAEIDGGKITDDGMALVLKVIQVSGFEVNLAFPHLALPALIEAAAHGITEGFAKQGKPDQRYPVQWVNWNLDPISTGSLLTMTLQSGGQLAFVLPPQVQSELLQAIANQIGATVLMKS